MSYAALVEHFSQIEDLPIPVDMVLDRIRATTDHKDIRLYPVERHNKAFRGAFRRLAIPKGKAYSHEVEIVCQIMYGADLSEDWKRLVIIKEALHVFDPEGSRVNTPDGLRKLIPRVISSDLGKTPFAPAIDDFLGAYRAMAVLLPREARRRLKAARDASTRTPTEIADYVKLPDFYVDIWLDVGNEYEPHLLRRPTD
jgi:hypothetical protein